MLTVKNQENLIHIANRFSTDAVKAIKRSDYAKGKEPIVKQDIKDFLDIVYEDNVEKFWQLDMAARDEFIDILQNEFCFIDADMFMKLSEIVINTIENNNQVYKLLHNRDAIEAINKENKELQAINTMLLKYAGKINPEMR